MQALSQQCWRCRNMWAAAAASSRCQPCHVQTATAGFGGLRHPQTCRNATASSRKVFGRFGRPLAAVEAVAAEPSGAVSAEAAPGHEGRQADGNGAAPAADDWIEVGLIRSVHGLRGEVKVEPLTDSPEDRLGKSGTRWLQQPEAAGRRHSLPPPTRVTIQGGRSTVSKGHEIWLVKLEEFDSPEAADALRGCKLLIRLADRPALEDEDEFYAQDLVGMAVSQHGSEATLGTVVDIYDGTGTHDTLRVLLTTDDPADARTVLVPFVKDIVPHVDLAQRCLTINPPEGLFDTSVPARRRRKNPRNKPPKL